MPLKTMWPTWKRSIANCAFIAALVMLMPESSSTTGRPSSSPVVNSTPLMRWLCRFFTAALSTVSSASKALTTATRGVAAGAVVDEDADAATAAAPVFMASGCRVFAAGAAQPTSAPQTSAPQTRPWLKRSAAALLAEHDHSALGLGWLSSTSTVS